MELSGEIPVKILCKAMGIQRSSFYAWKKHLSHPSEREKNLASNVRLFQEYHSKYPSHGYRWLNAKIRLDKNIVLSDPYAHKCCKIAGIKSKSKHYRYKKAGDPARIFPNLLLSEMQIDGPMQCIVSDMTAFYVKGTYHTDQGSVYASKAYNDLLPMYGITQSMSRAGTPTDNAAMESVNGWIKAEMFMDLHVTGEKSIAEEVDDYIHFFNEYRPAYTLGYLTPKQYRERHISKC